MHTITKIEKVQKVNYNYQTNSNESFNSLRAKLADKSTAWKTSYRGRFAASILQKNQPYSWIYEARSRDLSKETKKVLDKFIDNRLKEMKNQRSPFYKNQRKLSRSN
mgnify:FL=1